MESASASLAADGSIKLKRCKHGRIIIKDLSKKRLSSLSQSQSSGGTQRDDNSHHHHHHNRTSLKLTTTSTSQSSSKSTSLLQKLTTHHHQQTPPSSPPKIPKHGQVEVTIPKHSPAARTPATPPSNDVDDDDSSDIYDPEGPIIPISPGDSPPISPLPSVSFTKPKRRSDSQDDDVPSSAVQLNQQEKYLQKLNRQERVIEEVKVALMPFYRSRSIDKEQYKDVLRRAVPKICHSKNGEINPIKIRALVDAYVKKMKRH